MKSEKLKKHNVNKNGRSEEIIELDLQECNLINTLVFEELYVMHLVDYSVMNILLVETQET